jgi:hypothetical protein
VTASTAGELRAAFDRGFADPPAAAPGEQRALLLLSIGGEAYALPLDDVAAIHVDLRIAPVPSKQRALIGLATVRNVIIPVHDLAVALGQRALPVASRWTVIANGEIARAWSFDELEGQISIASPGDDHVVRTIEIAGRSRRILDLEELRDAA